MRELTIQNRNQQQGQSNIVQDKSNQQVLQQQTVPPQLDIVSTYLTLRDKYKYTDQQIYDTFSMFIEKGFPIKPLDGIKYEDYAKFGVTKENFDEVVRNAQYSYDIGGMRHFYSGKGQNRNIMIDNVTSRFLKEKYDLDVELGYFSAPPLVVLSDRPGDVMGITFMSPQQVADTREVRHNKEILERLRRGEIREGQLRRMLTYDIYGIPQWEYGDMMASQNRGRIRSVWGPQRFEGRSGIHSYFSFMYNFGFSALQAIGGAMEYISTANKLKNAKYYENVDNKIYESLVDHAKRHGLPMPAKEDIEEYITSEQDRRFSYRLQNWAETMKVQPSYASNYKAWHDAERFWMGAGEVIPQSLVAVASTKLLKNPMPGLFLLSSMASNNFNQMAKENNMSASDRTMIYPLIFGGAFIIERLTVPLGLNPFEEVVKKGALNKAVLNRSIEQAKKTSGLEFVNYSKYSLRDKNAFLRPFFKSYWKGSFSPAATLGSSTFSRVVRQPVGEGVEEVLQHVYDQTVYNIYDLIHEDEIIRDEMSERDVEDKMRFMTDFDTNRSAFQNWAKNAFNKDYLAPAFIFGAMGGLAGAGLGLGIEKLSNDPIHKNQKQASIMDMLIMSKGDVNSVRKAANEMYNKGMFGFVHTDGTKAVGAGERSLNDMAYEAFIAELDLVSNMYKKLGYDKLTINGAIASDVNFVDDVLALNTDYFAHKAQYDELMLELTKLKQTNAEAKVIESKQREATEAYNQMQAVENSIKEYTTPEHSAVLFNEKQSSHNLELDKAKSEKRKIEEELGLERSRLEQLKADIGTEDKQVQRKEKKRSRLSNEIAKYKGLRKEQLDRKATVTTEEDKIDVENKIKEYEAKIDNLEWQYLREDILYKEQLQKKEDDKRKQQEIQGNVRVKTLEEAIEKSNKKIAALEKKSKKYGNLIADRKGFSKKGNEYLKHFEYALTRVNKKIEEEQQEHDEQLRRAGIKKGSKREKALIIENAKQFMTLIPEYSRLKRDLSSISELLKDISNRAKLVTDKSLSVVHGLKNIFADVRRKTVTPDDTHIPDDYQGLMQMASNVYEKHVYLEYQKRDLQKVLDDIEKGKYADLTEDKMQALLTEVDELREEIKATEEEGAVALAEARGMADRISEFMVSLKLPPLTIDEANIMNIINLFDKSGMLYIDMDTKEGMELKELIQSSPDVKQEAGDDILNYGLDNIKIDNLSYRNRKLTLLSFNSSRITSNELRALEAINSLKIVENHLLDEGGNVRRAGIDTSGSLSLLTLSSQLLDSIKLADTFYESMDRIEDHILIHRDETEQLRTYKEDKLSEDDKEANKKLKPLLTVLNTRVQNLKEALKETEVYQNEAAEIAASVEAKYKLSFWVHILTDQKESTQAFKKFLEDAGIENIEHLTADVLKHYNIFLEEEERAKEQGRDTDKLSADRRQLINSLFLNVENVINKVFNDNDISKENIKMFFLGFLNDTFTAHGDMATFIPPAGYNKSYFNNSKAYNTLEGTEQGIEYLSQAFSHSNNNKYNGAYHFSMNYIHAMVNSNINSLKTSINQAVQNLKTYIPSVEQANVQIDIQNAIQNKKIDYFVFVNDINNYKELIGLVGLDKNPISIREAEILLKSGKLDEKTKKELGYAISAYKGSNMPKFDEMEVDEDYMSNSITVVGNAGTGKTEMVGFSSLINAIHNNREHIRISVSASTPELMNKMSESIDRVFKEYNESNPKDKRTYEVRKLKLQNVLAKEITATENGTIINDSHLVIFDEAGRFGQRHVNKIKALYKEANKGKITGFMFLGDPQQIQTYPSKTAEATPRYMGMLIQLQTVHTRPLQYTFRSGNNIITNLSRHFGKQVFASMYSSHLAEELPIVSYTVADDNVRDGANYYQNVNSVVEEFIKRRNEIGNKAVLIFETQEAFENYKKLYSKGFDNHSGVHVLYNSVEALNNNLLSSFQGNEAEEVYLAVEHHETKNRLSNLGKLDYYLTMTTGVTRAKRFVGMIADKAESLVDKTAKSLIIFPKPNSQQIEEFTAVSKENVNKELILGVKEDNVRYNKERVKKEEDKEEAVEAAEDVIPEEIQEEIQEEMPEEEVAVVEAVVEEDVEREVPKKKKRKKKKVDSREAIAQQGRVIFENDEIPFHYDEEQKSEIESVAEQQKSEETSKISTQSHVPKNDGDIILWEESGYQTQVFIKGESLPATVLYHHDVDGKEMVKTEEYGSVFVEDLDNREDNVVDENKYPLPTIGRGNFAITPGSVSKKEWDRIHGLKNPYVLGQIKAFKTRLLQGIYDGTLLNNNAVEAIKIVYSPIPEIYIAALSKTGVRETEPYSQIKIMIDVSQIDIDKLSEEEKIILQVIHNSQEDGTWMQVGNMYSFNNGNLDLTKDETIKKLKAQRVSFDNLNSPSLLDEQLLHLKELAVYFKEDKVYTQAEFIDILGIDHVNKYIHFSSYGIVPLNSLQIKNLSYNVKKDENEKQRIFVNLPEDIGANENIRIVADTMLLKDKIIVVPKYMNDLIEDINELKQLRLGEIEEDDYMVLRENIALRMMLIPTNRNIIGANRPFIKKAKLQDEAMYYYIKDFVDNLEAKIQEGNIDGLYVPIWHLGDVKQDNLYTNMIGVTNNMFIDPKSVLSQEKLKQARLYIEKEHNKQPDDNDGDIYYEREDIDNTEMWEELTHEMERIFEKQIGKEEYEGIVWNTDGFRKSVAGAVSLGKMHIKLVNGKIVKNVLPHEIFHMVFRHGITAQSKKNIIEDYRRQKIEQNIDMSNVPDDRIEEFMANEHMARPQVEEKPTTLWGRFKKFISDFIDSILDFFTDYTKVSTFDELSKNIVKRKYANKLYIDRGVWQEDAYYEEDREHIGDTDISEDENQSDELIRVSEEIDDEEIDIRNTFINIFPDNSSQVIALRYIKGYILDNTIFHQYKYSKITKLYLSLQGAIDSLRSELLELSNLEPEAYIIKHPDTGVDYDLRTMTLAQIKANLPRHSYSPLLGFAARFYGLTEKQFNTNFYSLARMAFAQDKSSSDYAQLWQESFTKSAVETMARPVYDIMTSLYVNEFDFIKNKNNKFDVELSDNGYISYDRKAVNINTIYDIAKILSYAYANNEFDMLNIKEGLKRVALIIQRAAMKNVRRVGKSNTNNRANQLMTISRYLYKHSEDSEYPTSLYGKIKNAKGERIKVLLEDFATAIVSQLISVKKRNPASVNIKKGLYPKSKNELSYFLSNKKERIQQKLFGNLGVYHKYIIDQFAKTQQAQKYEAIAKNRELIIAMREEGAGGRMKWIMKLVPKEIVRKDGEGEFVVELNPAIPKNEISHYIAEIFNMVGFGANRTEILYILENIKDYAEATEESLRYNIPENYLGFFMIGAFTSVQIGTEIQYLKNYINDATFKSNLIKAEDAEIEKNILTNLISELTNTIYRARSYNTAKKGIEVGIKNIVTVLNRNKHKIFSKEEIDDDIIPKLNSIHETAPFFKYLLTSFKGESFINNDAQIQNIPEEDIPEGEYIGITPSPLNFDIAFKTYFAFTEDLSFGSQTEYLKNGKTMSFNVIGNNNDELFNLMFGGRREWQTQELRRLNGKIVNRAGHRKKGLSLMFNSMLKSKRGEGDPLLAIGNLIHATEIIYGKRSSSDFQIGDILNAELTAMVKGIRQGKTYVPRSPFGDNNHLYLLELKGEIHLNLLQEALKVLHEKKRDRNETLMYENKAMSNVIRMLKNAYMTYHIMHINSVVNTMEAAEKLLLKHNLQEAAEGRSGDIVLLQHILDVKSYANEFVDTANVAEVKKVNEYNFDDTITVIEHIFEELTKLFGVDTFNMLESNGAANISDIEKRKGKLIPGRALSFNTYKDSDEHGEFRNVWDYVYNGKRMYKSSQAFKDEREGTINVDINDYNRTKSFMDFEPQTLGEATDMIWNRFGKEMGRYQDIVWDLIKNNELNYEVEEFFSNIKDDKGNRVVIRSSGYDENVTYNYGMLYYYLFTHFANFSLGHLLSGHPLAYGSNDVLYNRIKLFETPGHTLLPSEHGLGSTFKGVVMNDEVMAVEVERYDMITGNMEIKNRPTVLTDGSTYNTYLGRMYMYRSAGSDVGAMTRDIAWKPLYANYDMLSDEVLVIKDSNLAITPEHVLMNEDHVFIEYAAMRAFNKDVADNFLSRYAAMRAFNKDIADNFLSKYTAYIKKGDRRDVAFKNAIDLTIEEIQELRKTNPKIINDLVVSITHPSSVKVGRRKTNPSLVGDIDTLSELETIELRTEKLRLIFNPDSKAKDSQGEVFMKQAFNLALHLLDKDSADKLETSLSDAILKSMVSKYGMQEDGSIGNDKEYSGIIKRAVRRAIAGMKGNMMVGTHIELLKELKKDPELIQFSNVNTKIKQSINKLLANSSAKIRFTGMSYNQVADANFKVWDAVVTFDDGSKKTYTVTQHGADTLIKRFGANNVLIGESRKLKPMDYKKDKEGKIVGAEHGEVLAQTVNMHKFGIKPGEHYLMDLMFVEVETKDGVKTIDLNDIEENGYYGGEYIIDKIKDSLLLKLSGTKKFKDDLEKINLFKKSLYLQLYRKPTSLLSSGGKFKIVDFVSDNSVITSSKKIAWDDSDFDIDRLYGYEYSLKDHYEYDEENLTYTNDITMAGSLDNLLESMELAFDKLAEQGNLHVSISTEQLKDLGEVDALAYKSTPYGLYSGYVNRQNNIEGKESIDRYANSLITTGIFGRLSKLPKTDKDLLLNENYAGEFDMAYRIAREYLEEKDYSHIVNTAIMVQAALDNAKQTVLGNAKMSRHATNEIIAMLFNEEKVNSIIDFLQSPFVREIYDTISSNLELTTTGRLVTPFMVLSSISYKLTDGKSYVFPRPSEKEMKHMKEYFKNIKSYDELKYTYHVNISKLEREDLTEDQRDEKINVLTSKLNESIQYSDRAKYYAYYMLQQYALAGEVFKRITFLTDIMDGAHSKDFEQSRNIRMIENVFGKNFEEIDLTDEGIKNEILEHDDDVLTRLMQWHTVNNDYYLRLSTENKPANLILENNVNDMFKFANLFNSLKLMRTHGLIHKFQNNILENTIDINSKEMNRFKRELMLKLGIGRDTNSSRYYAIMGALQGTVLSETLINYVNNHSLFEGGFDLSMYKVEQSGRMVLDEHNDGFSRDNKIDLTISSGRSRYIKRLPSYMMSFSEILQKLYDSEGKQRDIYIQILEQYYNVNDISQLLESLTKYSGDNFFNYVTTMGAQYNQLLVVRDSHQIKDNISLFSHIQELYNVLPQNIKDMLGIYELIINELTVRKSSLYDFIGANMFKEMVQYLPNPDLMIDNENTRNIIYQNIALSPNILYVEMRENNDELIPEIIDRMERTGADEIYVKIKLKEKLNNKNIVFKKITREDIEIATDEEGNIIRGFDDIGSIVFFNPVANSLPYSSRERLVSEYRVMNNLNEQNIAEILTKGKTKVHLYRGHNYKEEDRYLSGTKEQIVYMTNAGVAVRIKYIGREFITIEVTDSTPATTRNVKSATQEQKADKTSANEKAVEMVERSNQLKYNYERDGIYYKLKEDKKNEGKAISVTSILDIKDDIKNIDKNRDYALLEDEYKIAISDGNVVDAIMKDILPLLVKMDNINVFKKFAEDEEKVGGSPIINTFVKAVQENYKDIEIDHPLKKHLDDEIMLRKIGYEYIRTIIVDSELDRLINRVTKHRKMEHVETVSDIMSERNFEGTKVVGVFDFMFLYRDKGRLAADIVEIKAYKPSPKGMESKPILKAGNQTRLYSILAHSTHKIETDNSVIIKVMKPTDYVTDSKARMVDGQFKVEKVANPIFVKVEPILSKERLKLIEVVKETIDNINSEIASREQVNEIIEVKKITGEVKEEEC